MFSQWITSYFQHGDISTRDPDVLSYIVPSIVRAPTIYNMSAAQINEIVDESLNVPIETPYLFNFTSQSYVTYRKALFDPKVRDILPFMKVWALVGEFSCSFSLAAYFSMLDDDEAEGGGRISFNLMTGVNHFVSGALTL